MSRAAAFIFFALLCGNASAKTLWKGTSPQSTTSGSGDVLAAAGATLILSAESTGSSAFVGAITSLDAAPFRGKEVRLAAHLRVIDGAGSAALWIRADGADGRLGFTNSGGVPVRRDDGAQSRELLLYIPSETTHLRFGATLDSPGRVEVDHITLSAQAPREASVTAHDVLSHALPIIRAKALNAGNVDWPAREQALLSPDLKKLPAQEAYARLQMILHDLADGHSVLRTPKDSATRRQRTAPAPTIEARPMQDIGYVRVPALSTPHASTGTAFTSDACEKITALAAGATKGFIVDLRANTGGNMWPMLNGLRPLLGAGDVGAFRNRAGEITPWRARSSQACSMDLATRPVAVLVGPKTASSGEAVAIAFRNRPGTRFFGQPTAGLATANTDFPLADGGMLHLTTAATLDRAGTAYPQGVRPESQVPEDQDPIETAARWLRGAP